MLLLIALTLFSAVVCLFILFIIRRDRGNKEPAEALMTSVGLGVAAVIAASILNVLFVPKSIIESIGSGTVLASFPELVVGSFTIGLIEESLKCIPLALIIYKRRYFNELTDGIIYFGLTALTFGVIENISYTIELGGAVGISRAIMSPYLHTSFTILFGLALAFRKVAKTPWLFVGIGMAAAISTHGIYDMLVFTNTKIGILVAFILSIFMNVMLFILFNKAKKLDEIAGRSSTGINKFCRNCGAQNKDQLLYCSFCGKLS